MRNFFITAACCIIGLAAQSCSKADDVSSMPKISAQKAEAHKRSELPWMKGFPPPPEQTIRFTDPDFFAGSKLRWTVCHFRELMPTTAVATGSSGINELSMALDPHIGALTFPPQGTETSMTWDEAFEANYSDGIIVLHNGKIVYERYDGCLDETKHHGVMSVTKSLTGLIAEILVANGSLNETAQVGTLIPELANSAFGDATVRQVMDMTTGLKFSENYADPNADIWTYSKAVSVMPPPPGYTGPRSYFDYLQTIQKSGEHGEAFGYRTVNADALGWIIARTTGQSVNQWFSQNIWSQIGTQREAFYTVDSIGTPFAGGGFNTTLRDAARLGQLILDNGKLGDKQIIPASAINSLKSGGNRDAFDAGNDTLPGWSYKSMWWVSHNNHGAFAARGVHGQTLWIDPKANMVIVRFASHPKAANAANDANSLPAYQAVGEYLLGKSKGSQ